MTRIKKQKSVKNIQRKNTQKLTLSNKPVRGLLFAPYEELKKNNICVISWDRITIAGTLFAELNRSTLLELGWHETKLINGYAQQFRLMRGRKQVAELIRNKHNGRNYWRLDTSNHHAAPGNNSWQQSFNHSNAPKKTSSQPVSSQH